MSLRDQKQAVTRLSLSDGTTRRSILTGFGAGALLASLGGCADTASTSMPTLKIAASVYVGWMPWMLAAESELLGSTGQKNGVSLSLIRGDYAETINQYIAGHVDAIAITNIDALAAFAEAKIASDVILIGSYSAGNDAILLPAGKSELPDGGEVVLVKNSVSEYVLARYLEINKRQLSSLKLTDVSDANLARTFVAAGDAIAGAVTWKPIVDGVRANANAQSLFDSAALPGEIADCLVVRRSVLEDHPNFAKALLESWFAIMRKLQGTERADTIASLARLSASTAAEYESQLATTQLMDTPSKALAALNDPALKQTMDRVAGFVADRELAKTDRPNWYSIGTEGNGTLRFNAAPLQGLATTS
jgi:NitT/TauT family transport system substrate-binding protein